MRATHDEATLAQAIACYHELCNDPKLAGPRVVAAFAQAQRDAGLTFGGTVQCRSLRPAFITAERLELLRAAVRALWSAFARLENQAISDPSFAAELGLSTAERDLIAIDPGYADATVISRLDTFFGATPRVLEYNADSPAGMSYQAGQASLMSRLPVFERFATDYELEPLRADIALRETLLDVWREYTARRGANGVLPRIAILDLPNAATAQEFRLIAHDFARHGISAIITTPEELSFSDGRLYAGGTPIDLVYKRLLVADFLARYDLNHPLVRAYASRAVCVASSFRCTIAHKKRALAAFWNSLHADWFSESELATIRALVPLTRPLDPAVAITEQATTVVKPNDAHGGEGIVVGCETRSEEWIDVVHRDEHAGYVMQERVVPVRETYPVFAADRPQDGFRMQPLIEDCNAYVFRGRLGGILTRLSEVSVINVSHGGQAIPTFVLRRHSRA